MASIDAPPGSQAACPETLSAAFTFKDLEGAEVSMMKTVMAFVVGAIVAAGLVYYKIGRDTTPAPAPTAQVVTPVAPAEPAAQPPAETPAPEPAAVTPAPVRTPVRTRPSPMRETPAKTPPRSTPATSTVAQNRPVTPAPAPSVDPAPAPVTPSPNPPIVSTPVNPSPVAPPPERVEIKKPEPRVPQTVTIPAGTLLTVRVDQTLTSETSEAGDNFRATLDSPLVIDGFVIAERGARTQGRVVEVDRGGRVRGTASMTLELVSVTGSDGQRIRVETASFARQAERSRGRDAAKVGAAAGIGAAIGAIAGGGKGAAIGAGVGAAAGTGGVLATRGGSAEVPAETRISFKLAQPVTVTEKLN